MGPARSVCERPEVPGGARPGLRPVYGVACDAARRPPPRRPHHRLRAQDAGIGFSEDCTDLRGGDRAKVAEHGHARSSNAEAAGGKERTYTFEHDDPPATGTTNDHHRSFNCNRDAVVAREQAGCSTGRDCMGIESSRSRPALHHEGRLEGIPLGHTAEAGHRGGGILCAGERMQGMAAPHQHASRETDCGSGEIHAKHQGRKTASLRREFKCVRKPETCYEEGVSQRSMATFVTTGGDPGGGEDGSGKKRAAGAPQTRERSRDGALPEDEHTGSTNAGGESAVFSSVIRGLQEGYRGILEEHENEVSGEQSGESSLTWPDLGKPPPRQAKLDSFPTSTINVQRLSQLATEAGMDPHFASWMTNPNAISEVKSGKIPIPGPKSNLPPSFVSACLKAGVCMKVTKRECVRGVVKVFTVPKSDPLIHRTVIDGRPINCVMPKPPKFHLFAPPHLFHILKHRKATWLAKIDLKGFFHQLPIHNNVSSFFCFRVGQSWYRWTRVPMGWSVAPYIAQNTAEALVGRAVGVRAMVYLDDILVFGESCEGVQASVAGILERFSFAGAEINEKKSCLSPVRTLEYIGVEWSPEQGVLRFPSTWREKVMLIFVSFASAWKLSIRRIWQMVGIAMRVLHVLGVPLCHFDAILRCLSGWSTKIVRGELDWDVEVVIPDDLRREMAEIVDAFVRPIRDFSLPEPASAWDTVVWTDASTTGWGIVWQHLDDAEAGADWGQWVQAATHRDIFLLEAEAAMKGIRAALESGSSKSGTLLLVDNEGLAHAIRRGHTKSRLGNLFLRYIFSFVQPHHLRVEWIASEENSTADQLSRRTHLSEGTIAVPLCWDRVHKKVDSFGFSE